MKQKSRFFVKGLVLMLASLLSVQIAQASKRQAPDPDEEIDLRDKKRSVTIVYMLPNFQELLKGARINDPSDLDPVERGPLETLPGGNFNAFSLRGAGAFVEPIKKSQMTDPYVQDLLDQGFQHLINSYHTEMPLLSLAHINLAEKAYKQAFLKDMNLSSLHRFCFMRASFSKNILARDMDALRKNVSYFEKSFPSQEESDLRYLYMGEILSFHGVLAESSLIKKGFMAASFQAYSKISQDAVFPFFLYKDLIEVCLLQESDSPTIDLKKSHLARAYSFCLSALKNKKDHPAGLYMGVGRTLFELGKYCDDSSKLDFYNACVRCFNKVLSIDPNSSDQVHANTAMATIMLAQSTPIASQKREHFRNTISLLKKVLRKDVSHPAYYYECAGFSFLSLADLEPVFQNRRMYCEEAANLYAIAFKVDPTQEAIAYINFGRALAQLALLTQEPLDKKKHFEKALDVSQKGLIAYPDSNAMKHQVLGVQKELSER